MCKSNRSALARFRCGVAPIRIETGRYERNYPPVEERTCFNCIQLVEDEFHVLMCCPLYADERSSLFSHASSQDPDFNILSDEDKFIYLLSDDSIISKCAYTLRLILCKRLHLTSRLNVT